MFYPIDGHHTEHNDDEDDHQAVDQHAPSNGGHEEYGQNDDHRYDETCAKGKHILSVKLSQRPFAWFQSEQAIPRVSNQASDQW